jgi:TBC1 domain family member 10
VGADDASSVYSSRHSTAMSDAGAGIGMSMLQDFLPDNADEGEDDEDEDGEDSDHESLSQSERGRTSLEETVDGFPAPPTQIPTPTSQASSFILDPRRPISSVSEDSEDGDGASFYDNYRYSRLSVSSKLSKSSGYTVATIPPPIPTELPPPVRSHSQGSQYSVPTQSSEPLSSPSEPSSSASPPPREVTSSTAATQAPTRTIPPPLTFESSEKGLEPSNSNLVTATTSPLLHGNFGAPMSPPSHPNSPIKCSLAGALPALRRKVEQSIVEDNNEINVPAGIHGTSPRSPTLAVATASGSPIASATSEKKRSGGPPPFVVMNPTPPPPPYTPKPPPPLETTSGPSTQTNTAMPTSAIPHIPSPAGAITGAMAKQTTTNAPQPLTTTNSSNIFLPHPNAPKPNSSPQAPLYGRAISSAPLLPPTLLIQAMRRAAQMRVGPNGLPRFCTIYGSTARDLSTAAGPVLIYFSLDPPNDIPASRMRVAPAPAPAPAPVVTVPPQLLPPPPPAPVPTPNQNSLSSVPAPRARQQPGQRQVAGATTDVIPRPGFFPKAGAVRPRSRSFSGFESAMAPETQSKEQRYVLHSSDVSFFFADAGTVHSRDTKTNSRPSTADSAPGSSPRVNRLAARAAAHTARIHQSRQYTPSPLSLSQSTTKLGSSSLATSVPMSPSTSSHPVSSPTSPTLRRRLTPVKSEPSLRSAARKSAPRQEREAPVPAPVPAASAPQSSVSKLDGGASSRVPASLSSAGIMNTPPSIRISASESQALSSHTAPGNESAFLRTRPRRQSSDSPRHNSSTAMDVDGSSSRPSELRTQAPLPPSTSAPSAPLMGRSGSLRSKISLSALRAKSARDDDGLHEADTVQVQDMDFELVRPNVRPRVSEDSAINGKSSGSEGRPSFLRIDSPAMSTTSGGGTPDTRSPVSPSGMSLSPVTASAASSVDAAVEAHRARELKWISVMSTTPPSQARKGKKIRKLLQEGVPASVRYQVWAHLTDSKAKRIEGLYAQFGEREKVSAFAEIQSDAQVCFEGDSRLSQPNGPLVSLLQAYLTMVPDIQYSKGSFFLFHIVWRLEELTVFACLSVVGLTFIAGQLLLQSPEEDAFWIFISLMDSHLRPYFSSNSVQLDIDASLFAKALETVNPSIAKKLFVDMAVAPIRVCRPWSVSFSFPPGSFNLHFVWS